MTEGSPLYRLLNEIKLAASHGMPFLAITMTLTLPDLCVSLSAKDGRTSAEEYKKWCTSYLPEDKFKYLTVDDIYSMRCGVIHNGRFGDLKHNVGRIIFTLPPTNMQACISNDAYLYNVVEFCGYFADAVYRWHEANKTAATVQENLSRLMQYRAEGFPPYIMGVGVLA
ncbi:hypothetical protein MRS76_11315 [Rhizobiaceae bacterium n13]|uniref:hypothetical protein n=1 Tax=Ferirhizobium litorale TaxID=2927786 RepID=UPI0024B30FA2|nr:hypothetical protein [Fererhizobium litorale]MDI7862550.1 hypothetical protein [Fererhizobium litorale]